LEQNSILDISTLLIVSNKEMNLQLLDIGLMLKVAVHMLLLQLLMLKDLKLQLQVIIHTLKEEEIKL
jgi:hypothetical protein